MDPVVIAFGGSVLAPDEPDPAWLAKVAAAIQEWSAGRRIFVVTGGGRAARRAIALARECKASEEDLDRVGIQATRLNAQILIAYLHAAGVDCNSEIPTTARGAGLSPHPVVVLGGTSPGHSTDHVGADVARHVRAARLVIATDVDGVYDKDPRRHDDAQRMEAITYEELRGIVGEHWSQAGMATVVDPLAVALLAETGTEAFVVDGKDLDNLAAAVHGQPCHGTRILEAA